MVEERGRMPRSAGPAGNVVATARDLADFCDAVFSEDSGLLSAELIEQMLHPQVQTRDGGQGLAWVIPSSNLAVHGGSTRGSTAFLAAIPGVGSMTIVANGPGAGAIAREVQAHVFGIPPRRDPGPGNSSHVDPESCTGPYTRRNVQVDITYRAEGLVATSRAFGALAELFPEPPEPVVLNPIGGGRFLSSRPYEDKFGIWDFNDLNGDGAPTRLLTRRLLNRVC